MVRDCMGDDFGGRFVCERREGNLYGGKRWPTAFLLRVGDCVDNV